MRLLPLAAFVAFLAPAAMADAVKIQLPLETAVYKTAPGAQLANGQCLTCHSADYSAMQPPKPRDFWKSEVEKMRDKYGAPIPTDELEDLIAYFARNYGSDASVKQSTNAVPPAVESPDRAPIDAQALALKSGCLSCHNVNTKVVGPAYREIAAKYRGNPDGPHQVAQQIRQGGGGKWGQIPMPPFPQFTPSEVEALAQWVLGQ
jgi:cytochrome c